jgi:hypothetical protein|tara:strand:- start:210 stop:419 length:210 start_codon:yes stop_codon:yes gene_type:complete
MEIRTQKQNILKHLQDGSSITPLTALESYGCFRLAAIVFDLKKEGWNIKTNITKNSKKKFAVYNLDNLD